MRWDRRDGRAGGIHLEARDLEREGVLTRRLRWRNYRQALIVLFESYLIRAPKEPYSLHGALLFAGCQRLDNQGLSRPYKADRVQVVAFDSEANVIFAKLRPVMGAVDGIAVDLEPFSDFDQGALLRLVDFTVSIGR